MNFIERVMRLMTHVNIGTALGLVAWVLWSGWQVVTGQIAPAYSAAEAKALVSLAHAGHPLPLRLVPVSAQGAAALPCHEAQPSARPGGVELPGADL